jgi:bacterioferritin
VGPFSLLPEIHAASLIYMKGNAKVVEALNAGLTIELTAINQYFICSKMCSNWGLEKLASHFYDESIEEMKHAEEVIDRILYLDGVPEIARYDVIKAAATPLQQIEDSMALEKKGVATYNAGISLCLEIGDSGSRELMERMVVESEDSIDWAEAQLDLIKMVGIENYLAQQISKSTE